MKLEPFQCPKCAARLNLAEGANFCRCDHCGTNFTVTWPQPDQPALTAFETILTQLVTQQDFLVADRRLSYLAQDVAAARAELEAATAELGAAQTALATVTTREKKAVRRLMTLMAALCVATVLSLYPVLAAGRLWLILSLALAIGALYTFVRWRQARENRLVVTRGVEKRVKLARQRCSAAQSCLNELELESKLCEGKTRRFRYQGGTLKPKSV